jgi:iron complex outermembrane receptor protein
MAINNSFGLAGTALALAITSASAADAEKRKEVSTPAEAPATTGQIETVTVTAQRRSQSAQDVSISITAITGDKLEKAGIATLDQLSGRTPNLFVVDRGSNSNNGFAIRGINAISNVPTIDSAVAVYVDNVYIARNTFFSQSLYDIDRVEVLRGPQGALYGRNALGGAINVLTRPAGSSKAPYIEVSAGNYGKRGISGAGGIELSDNLDIRFAGNVSEFGGYIKNAFDGSTIGGHQNYAGRVSIHAQPSSRLQFDLTLESTHAAGEDAAVDLPIGTGRTGLIPVGLAFGYVPEDPYNRTVKYDTKPTETLTSNGVTLKGQYDLGDGATITSITSFRNYGDTYFAEVDRLPYKLVNSGYTNQSDTFSQELRFATAVDRDLAGVFGLYFYREKMSDTSSLVLGDDLKGLFGLPPFLRQEVNTVANSRATSYAAFGEIRAKTSETTTLIFGGRLTREQKELDLHQISDAPLAAGLVPGVGPLHREYSESKFSPAVALEWRPEKGFLYFAKAASGFKSGGFNSRFPGPDEKIDFKGETLTSFELGAKTTWLDRRLTVNGTVYVTDHRNKQVQTFTGTANVTDNAGRVDTKGFELEVEAKPIQGLTLTGAIGVTRAVYKDYIGPGGVNYAGNRVDNTPSSTASFSAEYTLYSPLPLLGKTTFRADYSHVGKVFYTSNNDPDLMSDGYGVWNARMTVQPTKNLTFSAYVNNVADTKFISYGYDSTATTGLKYISLGAPRTFGLTGRYTF